MFKKNEELVVIKKLDILLNKPKRFEWQISLLFFILNDKKLSPHMAQMSEHNNYPNNNIHSYDKMSKMIVNLGSKKWKNNNNSTCQLSSIQICLLIIIFDTPEKDLSNVDQRSDMRKVRTYWVNSSSTLFYCSIRAMYNIINRAKKPLMLKSNPPGINTSIFPKRYYDNIFDEK